MVSIKIDDVLFAHAKYSTDFQESKYIIWDRNFILGNEKIAIYTDNSLTRVNKRVKTKVAWLLESPVVSSYWHNWIVSNFHLFDIIFTNNVDLLGINERFKFLPTAGCWIKPEDQKMWDKNKLVSIIASNKNFTNGHKLRNEIVDHYKSGGLDIYGRGFNEIPYKLNGLKDYRFSIVVENTKKDFYFTEKLIDCFATGTVPIYWGCPSIGNFFDIDGVISFNTLEDLKKIINSLSIDLYNSKIESIKNNLHKSKEYLMAEDYMWEKYLKECF